nr:odorant receptor 3 [Graphosoma rubrolineatum]
MVFGSSVGKWLDDKLIELKDYINDEIDEKMYAFIDKEYFHLMQISCLYVKLDRRNRLISFVQIIFYLSVLFLHYFVLSSSTVLMIDINMVLFCQNIHFTLLVQLTIILLVFFQNKHRQMTLFHRLLSCNFFDYQEPTVDGEDALRSSMVRERRMLSVIPIAVALAAGAVLIIAPIVDKQAGLFDFENLSRVFSTHLPYPYAKYTFNNREGFNYYFALGGQVVLGILLTGIIGSGGFLFLNMSQNLSLQLQLLQNSLDKIETRAEVMYLKLYGKPKGDSTAMYDDHHFIYCYNVCLNKNFKHHQIILRAFQYTAEIISIPVFLAYMTGTIVIALSLISAGSADELPGTTLASMVLCGVEVGYMFLFSVFGQRIGDLNMELRFKIYNIKWYLCSRRIKMNLMVFQERTMKPLTMMAGGIVPANMETFATVSCRKLTDTRMQ